MRRPKPLDPIAAHAEAADRSARHRMSITRLVGIWFSLTGAPEKLMKKPSTRGIFSKIILWCAEHRVAPEDYIETLHNYAKPNFPTLSYEKMLVPFLIEDVRGWRFYKELRDGSNGIQASYLSSIRARTIGQEVFRKRHALAGTSALCLLQRDPIGLYDPRSSWCEKCAHQKPCEKRLSNEMGPEVVQERRLHRV